jgi:alcohol dehydrogenase
MPVLQDWVSFQFPSKIFIEIDAISKFGPISKSFGNRFLLITTQKEMMNPSELFILKTSIEKNSEGVIIYDDIESIGTFKELDTAAHFAKQSQVNCIISYGSFETVNIAKVVATLTTNDLFAEELIYQKKPTKRKPLPLVIVPTMPLMGIECSPFCTIYDDRENERKYFASPDFFPSLIIADPKVSTHMTFSDIAKTGTSTLAAAIDTILSRYSNEITYSSSLRSIELISKNIINSIRDPKNLLSKNALYSASILSGISQSVSSLGLCFAISLATISLTKLDIFQAMSILLPHIMEYYLTTSANKYVMIARALDEDTSDISVIEAAIKAVEGIRKIYIELKIPQRLSEYEVKKNELPKIAALAHSMPFLDSLPKDLPKNEIETILVAAY